ncbi:hypothetical protein L9F63_007307, partial [Diploptera punctata]
IARSLTNVFVKSPLHTNVASHIITLQYRRPFVVIVSKHRCMSYEMDLSLKLTYHLTHLVILFSAPLYNPLHHPRYNTNINISFLIYNSLIVRKQINSATNNQWMASIQEVFSMRFLHYLFKQKEMLIIIISYLINHTLFLHVFITTYIGSITRFEQCSFSLFAFPMVECLNALVKIYSRDYFFLSFFVFYTFLSFY